MPRLTTAQALVRFLAAQAVRRDGVEMSFFGGCLGIFGHGNVGGVGQALAQEADLLRYHQARNEQAMVHTAVGYARERRRLGALACTTSIGPGATNLVTGAATATINRLPVLLLPGEVFASRRPDPVLQQLEQPGDGRLTVNDTLRPVSRYWDRIDRPEQLGPALLAAMRVLTDQAETGAVTISLPQDVATEADEFPAELLAPRVWPIWRPAPDPAAVDEAARRIAAAERPLIVAGGGVLYAEAAATLADFAERTGIPVAETQAGKGSLTYGSPGALGAIGATGTAAANRVAAEADLVIGVGTRWSDFTTASKTLFAAPGVSFANVNVAAFDAGKLAGLALVGDARATLEALAAALGGHQVEAAYRELVVTLQDEWEAEVTSRYADCPGPLPSQAAVIGAVEAAARPEDVVVCAAGSMPGDLHKLWRARRSGSYHVEYGYSCMGYEIAGGLGVKLAAPEREVFVMVGDGSYLMMSTEIVTAVQEGLKLTIVLVDNGGYASIGALSRSLGSDGFGTLYRYRVDDSLGTDGADDGARLPVDLAANAASLGATVMRADGIEELREALVLARALDSTVVIQVETDRYASVPSYGAEWDVPVAAESEQEPVREARRAYERLQAAERPHLDPIRREDA
jgi:3D-(3,5/4)-trihydroxycyclohexane-1,2-dione acylhydrolase (decyclizing)